MPPTQPTSQLDSYIVERIIRALELVTEMGTKLDQLEKTILRQGILLEGSMEHSIDSLPLQIRLLRDTVAQLQRAWQEKKEVLVEEVKGRSSVRIAAIQTVPAILGGSLMYLLTKWLGG